ncbi:divergent polysaccharide deacetylase family protein [Pelagibacterium sp. 26DY04]|uniref:divergent polysaccharide deacetylase family protein n=1 Tax=Pelagibacterium sp. 26DY04 TaxID=2967130 RepID=UPI0028159C03|nr:divergent polysaccharide deacetylase family protein [Pelagibacterium sp. 26DY04]WMT86839.1 divergent polysaccharide deacetylase family protein [Pelagibacterium sp. 26DY04]
MTDELSAPLGRKRRKNNKSGSPSPMAWPWGRIGAALLALIVLGVVGWIVLVDDPLGGRPVAEAPVNTQPVENPVAIELASPSEPAQATATPADGPSIITLSDIPADDDELAAAGPDRDLFEMTENGPLPRVSPSGLAPHEAYARPSISPASAGGRKLIAVVVSGLGLSEATTREAIDALPGTVTLAFAPYGGNLTALADEARADGHELMLEIPLEPFDYPQNDPGPHTLLVDQPPRDNLEKLYWLLTRMTGYTGVLNHMGARFTASAADFAPVMEELGLRGLAYLDDGSSNRSVAPQLARQNDVPYARIDAVIDTNPSQAAIMSALDGLKAAADQRGQALGILSALPVSIRTLADWADTLDEEQYLLVPVSTLSTLEANQ